MKRIAIILTFLLIVLSIFVEADARRPRPKKRAKARTHRVIRKRAKPKPLTIHEKSFWQCEDTCHHVHGIDMSHYQGEVFWDHISKYTAMSYVYLKATEGSDRIDERYEQNIFMAHRHGLKVGSYHFFRPKIDLTQQLQNFTTQCLPEEQDLIPMLDVESTGGLSTTEFCDSLIKFLTMMENAYNQKPLIYTGRNFYNKHLIGMVDGYQLMIAMYTDEAPVLADNRDFSIWQYTCRGRLKGVSGYVDKSRFMGEHNLNELRFVH